MLEGGVDHGIDPLRGGPQHLDILDQEGLGLSRGGFSTKIHARGDGKARPVGFVLTPGQTNDNQGFLPLVRMIGERVRAMIADKGYDADAIREELNFNGIEAVIPPKTNRTAAISSTPTIQTPQSHRTDVQ